MATKKKKFKAFNANKIDASTVTTETHVDAPEVTAEHVTSSLGGLGLGAAVAGAEDTSNGNDQWADSQGGWGPKSNATAPTTAGDSKVAELLDMQALNAKRNEQDDVAERLRIEETKEQLARAKEGMAKEAERMEAAKANKGAQAGARFAGARGGSSALGGGGGGSSGGKWIPSHMRNTGGAAIGGPRFGMSGIRGPASMDGSGVQKPVDTANEELFPDLAAAENIIAEKEKQVKDKKERLAGRAPVGWGGAAAMTAAAPAQRRPLNLAKPPAERKPLNLAPSKKVEPQPAPKKEEKEEKEEKKEDTKPEAGAMPAESPAPAVATPAAAPAPTPAKEKPVEKKKVLKKKKKKDLSTFKPKA